jgi:beta-galactosidase/beta-glucuronidase
VLLTAGGPAQPAGPLSCPGVTPGQPVAAASATSPAVPTPAPLSAPATPTAVLAGAEPVRTAGAPSVVEVRGAPYHYAYYVNGTRAQVRGIGYNVAYRAWGWDCAARTARYDRDFAAMRAAGFNTLVGWDEGEFDDLTLDKADQYGLGVVFPYDLPPSSDWSDPAIGQIHLERIERLVRRYANHPALRLWGPGNEVTWNMPDVAGPKARAFAAYYASVVERIHQLDPSHPIVYRDSEDLRFQPVRDALRERGLEQPWMVYGTNAFSFRLGEILDNWPAADFRVPLLVSEFGLVNYPPAERAEGLARMWDIVRRHEAYVLGGSVYAWTTEGIERLDGLFTDRVFGLVDGDARPVDGALDALRAALAETPQP